MTCESWIPPEGCIPCQPIFWGLMDVDGLKPGKDDLQWSNENGEETKWPDISGKRYPKMPLGHFTLSLFGCNWVWRCFIPRILCYGGWNSRGTAFSAFARKAASDMGLDVFFDWDSARSAGEAQRLFGWDGWDQHALRWWPMGMANGVSKWLWLYHVIPCYTMLYLSPRHG